MQWLNDLLHCVIMLEIFIQVINGNNFPDNSNCHLASLSEVVYSNSVGHRGNWMTGDFCVHYIQPATQELVCHIQLRSFYIVERIPGNTQVCLQLCNHHVYCPETLRSLELPTLRKQPAIIFGVHHTIPLCSNLILFHQSMCTFPAYLPYQAWYTISQRENAASVQ